MPRAVMPVGWAELESQLDALLDAAPVRRAALLDALSGGDADRRSELARLLSECERERPLLNVPAAERFAALFEDAPVAFPASLADRYRMKGELGRGGMAMVYLADDLKHAREVAVKVVRPEFAAAVGRARFLREIGIAARLRHPHIVPLYDSGEADGLVYYVMPYEPGLSLRHRLADGPLPVHEAVGILRDVCDAMAHAHQHGIVHRDIKPDNVLLSGQHALVTDFGVARSAEPASGGSTGTTAGVVMGTPAYMSPEQIVGDPRVDHRADIYSFGVLAYEVLAGRPPFTDEASHAVIEAHLAQAPEPLARVAPDVPPALAELVMRCLAKRPADRWQHAVDILVILSAGITTIGPRRLETATRDVERALAPVRRGTGRWRRWAAATGVLAGLGALLPLLDSGDGEPGAAPQGVAVLVFNHGDAEELQSLATGLTSELIGALGRVPRLQVRSMDAVWAYRAGVTVDSIRRALNVRWIVGGRVFRLGDSVKVTAELTNAETGGLIDGRTASAAAGQELALLQDLVATVATMLRERVGAQVRLEEWRAGTRSDTAFGAVNRADAYARDYDFLAAAGNANDAWMSLRRADSSLARAARADPNWEEPLVQAAWVARKTAYLLFGIGGPVDSLTAAIDRGIGYAAAALRVRPGAPRALEVLGILLHARWYLVKEPGTRDALLARAETALTDATHADTTLARALNVLSMIHFDHGRFEQARLTLLRAHAVDAYAEDREQVLSRLYTYSFEDDEDLEARRWCTEFRTVFRAHFFGGLCHLELMAWDALAVPRPDSAWAVAHLATAVAGELVRSATAAQLELAVASVLARSGLRDSAIRVADRVHERIRSDARLVRGPPASTLLEAEASARVQLGQRVEAWRLLWDHLARQPERGPALERSRRFRAFPVRQLLDSLGRV